MSEDAPRGFGATSRGRTLAMYAVIVAIALVVLQILLRVGDGIHGPPAAKELPGTKEAINVQSVFWKLLLACAVVIALSRVVGLLFRRIGQPQVMGEIVAGIILGPSVLGALWPWGQHQLFAPNVLPFIDGLAEVGLVIFMFLIGLELDFRLIRGRGHAAAMVSHASIIVPFLSGVGLGLAVFTELGSAHGKFVPFALFLGASMSITAFPVLARILTERGLHKTRLGAVTITCAAIDDVTAWCLLAVVIAVSAAQGPASAVRTVVLAALFIAFMVSVVRPAVARLASYTEDMGGMPPTMFAIVLTGLLLSAIATDRIGIHAIFGAFLFGAILPQQSEFVAEITGKLEDFAVVFLLPLFFAYSGLRTELGQLGTNAHLWLLCAAIVAVAILGKWGGSSVAARLTGLSWRESLGLGILMNCRGLTELVILNIGLDLGVIPPALFAMLVIMALVTTFMTTPILAAIYPPEEQQRMIEEEGGIDDESVFRVLVHVSSLDHGFELVHLALSMAAGHEEVQVGLLRTIRPADSAFRSGLRQDHRSERAAAGLRPLVQFVEGAGHTAVPIVVATRSVGEAVVRLADERRPNVVLMSLRSPVIGGRLRHGSLGEVLRDAPADVAVLVDPGGRGTALRKGARILVPYGAGFHEHAGLDLALRLAKTAGANVHLLGGGGDEESVSLTLAEEAAGSYERYGVWTTSESVSGDAVGCILAEAAESDLVVLGVSERWADEGKGSLGRLRDVVAGATTTPLLVVRRHGQTARRGPRRWFGARSEWMEEVTDGDAAMPETSPEPANLA